MDTGKKGPEIANTIPFFLGRGVEGLEGKDYEAVCPYCAGFDRMALATRTYLFKGENAKKTTFHEMQNHLREEWAKLSEENEALKVPDGWSLSEFHGASLNLKESSSNHEGRHIAFWEYQRAYAWLQWKEAHLARSGKGGGYAALRFLHTVRNSFLLRRVPMYEWADTMECLLIRDIAPKGAVTNSEAAWGDARRPRYCAADGNVDANYDGDLHRNAVGKHWRYLLFPDMSWNGHAWSSLLRYRPDDENNAYTGWLEFWDVNTGQQWNDETFHNNTKEFDYRSIKTAGREDFQEKLGKIQQFFRSGEMIGNRYQLRPSSRPRDSSMPDDPYKGAQYGFHDGWMQFFWHHWQHYGNEFKKAFSGWSEQRYGTGKQSILRKVRSQKIGNCGYKNVMKGVNLIITLMFEGMDNSRYGKALSEHLETKFLRAEKLAKDNAQDGTEDEKLNKDASDFDKKWQHELSSPQRVAKAFGIDSKRDSLVYLREEWKKWKVCEPNCKDSGQVPGYKSMQHMPIVDEAGMTSLRCQWFAKSPAGAQDGGQEATPGLEWIPIIGDYLRLSERDAEFQEIWWGAANKYDVRQTEDDDPPRFVLADCKQGNDADRFVMDDMNGGGTREARVSGKQSEINDALERFSAKYLPTIRSATFSAQDGKYSSGPTVKEVFERFKEGWEAAFEVKPYSANTFMKIFQALQLTRKFGCHFLGGNEEMRELTARCQST